MEHLLALNGTLSAPISIMIRITQVAANRTHKKGKLPFYKPQIMNRIIKKRSADAIYFYFFAFF